jgi:hypothetical protein
MINLRKMARLQCAAWIGLALFLVSSATPASGKKTKLIVTVSDRDTSLLILATKVIIKPLGQVEGWPKHKDKLELDGDEKGRVSVMLGAGRYLVQGSNPGGIKLPADTEVTIEPGQNKPVEIRLVLRYWDCDKVTCEV